MASPCQHHRFGRSIYREKETTLSKAAGSAREYNLSTCLPSFLTLDAFYFYPWPRTLNIGGKGGESLSNRPPRTSRNNTKASKTGFDYD